MNNIDAGIGDVLLRYPELIEDLTERDRNLLAALPKRYIALHRGSSQAVKMPPKSDILFNQLKMADVPFVEVGREACPPGTTPKLRFHIEVVRRATGFIGTLSCFNVVAQLAKVPSFVLVNQSIKEPFVYGLMNQNGARVEAWNTGTKSVEAIYYEASLWAQGVVREPTP